MSRRVPIALPVAFRAPGCLTGSDGLGEVISQTTPGRNSEPVS